MIFLKIIGIVLLLIIIFFMAGILNSVKYKIKLIYKEYKINYDIRISLFFNIISIIVDGTNENIEVFVKVMFFKKELKTDIKKQTQNNVDMEDRMENTSFRIINTLKIIYKHREYLDKFISIIKPKYIKIEGIYGFGDPYITGILSGFIAAVSLLLPVHSIKLNSDFFNKVFNLEVRIQGRTRIVLLIILIFKFIICNAYENIQSKLKGKFKRRLSMGRIRFKNKKSKEVKLD